MGESNRRNPALQSQHRAGGGEHDLRVGSRHGGLGAVFRSIKWARQALALATLTTASMLLASCSNLAADPSANADTTNTKAQSPSDPIVAHIDGEPIHQEQVDRWLKNDWLRGIGENPAELYELRRAGIEGVIDDTLIERAAAASGLPAEEYLAREKTGLGAVTEAEIDRFYARYQERIQPPEPLDKLRPKIRAFLEADPLIRVVTELRGAAKIEVVMTPPPRPPVTRQAIAPGGVSRGPDDAPITIVEFSDYQCPFCQRVEGTLHQLDARYPGKLRFVYRHLPLEFHENALPAAAAAICAGQQSRFWDYHDLLFANQRALSAPHLVQYATQLELDEASFRACLQADATVEQIAADVAAGKAAGASATPTFFINGIMLRGAQGIEAFQIIIDQELADLELERGPAAN
ncbi:MAG: thioredoxin domain-containing protein [Deltaproteobacteria bacterium]|nr:thioredoxin domain-containing protein [Deltaproteobacteria bacterium]